MMICIDRLNPLREDLIWEIEFQPKCQDSEQTVIVQWKSVSVMFTDQCLECFYHTSLMVVQSWQWWYRRVSGWQSRWFWDQSVDQGDWFKFVWAWSRRVYRSCHPSIVCMFATESLMWSHKRCHNSIHNRIDWWCHRDTLILLKWVHLFNVFMDAD